MGKKIFIIHTSNVSYNDLQRLCEQIIPEVEVRNIVDDSLLQEVKTVGHVTPDIIARMCSYFKTAEMLGADLILNQCSSVGEAAAIAAKCVNIPVLRIDRPMAEKAVEMGGRIAVVATVASTVAPSCALIEQAARDSWPERRGRSLSDRRRAGHSDEGRAGAAQPVCAGNAEEV